MPAQPVLAVADGVECRRGRCARVDRGALLGEDRADGGRDRVGQRDLDEDQRLVAEPGVEEAEQAAVRHVDPAAEIVPAVDGVHRLVADDLLEDRGGGLPVNLAQIEEAAVEPGGEQALEVVVHHPEVRVMGDPLHQFDPQGDKRLRPAGDVVEAAEELHPARLGGLLQRLGGGLAGGGDVGLGGGLQLFGVRPVVVREGAEHEGAAGIVEIAIGAQEVARLLRGGGLAAAGQQRLDHLEQRLAAGAPAACAVRRRSGCR